MTSIVGKLDGIKTVTDVIPDAGALTTLAAAVTAVKAVTDVIPDAGALTTLAAAVTAVKAVTDVIPDAGALTTLAAAVTAVKAVTDVLPNAGALTDVSAGTGTSFIIKKTMVSSAILQASNVDITGVSSGGDLLIEGVVVQTDGTGLATGTNFELLSNNTRGQVNIFVETVANLGANKTVDLGGATVTGVETVLTSGKKLQVHSTVAACDGAGEIDIYVKFKRLSAGATISPL
jgi:hypothetical protein